MPLEPRTCTDAQLVAALGDLEVWARGPAPGPPALPRLRDAAGAVTEQAARLGDEHPVSTVAGLLVSTWLAGWLCHVWLFGDPRGDWDGPSALRSARGAAARAAGLCGKLGASPQPVEDVVG